MSMLNGHGGPKDENVASLDEARKRAAVKAKAAKRAGKQTWTGPNPGPQGPRTGRDWIIGGIIILMAVAVVVWFVMKFVPSSGGM